MAQPSSSGTTRNEEKRNEENNFFVYEKLEEINHSTWLFRFLIHQIEVSLPQHTDVGDYCAKLPERNCHIHRSGLYHISRVGSAGVRTFWIVIAVGLLLGNCVHVADIIGDYLAYPKFTRIKVRVVLKRRRNLMLLLTALSAILGIDEGFSGPNPSLFKDPKSPFSMRGLWPDNCHPQRAGFVHPLAACPFNAAVIQPPASSKVLL